MTDETASQIQGTETKLDSLGSMLVNVFLEPLKVFHRIKRKPHWILPLLIFLVLVLASTHLLAPYQLEVQEMAIESSQLIPEGQKAEILAKMGEGGQSPVWPLVGAAAVTLLLMLAFVGVVEFIATFILQRKVPVVRVFSVLVWAELIAGLGLVVKAALVILKGSALVTTSLAILLPGDDPFALSYLFLGTFTDIFVIWQTIILVFGFAILFDIKRSHAAMVAIVPMVLLMAMSMSLGGGAISGNLALIGIGLLAFLALYVGFAGVPAFISHFKGGKFVGWYFYSFFLWPIAFVHSLLKTDKQELASESVALNSKEI